ncbi:Tm-1-like ATP-binding domain-containing protein [Kallotenue papyrolyticum]|uniref:Tm-1-like ATP-binding domain-containing protein n=1 Tax=Kallotenue papyrolyticum TaxID=1325125 RepID=UPI00047209BA|nr:Tm-1-like ATP-binding domain-containing protein [Kallotenue papyrolyticum]
MPTVLLIGTLDTKGGEIAYLRDVLQDAGLATLVLDAGILGAPLDCQPDISRADVAQAAGTTIEELRAIGTRGAAVERMAQGVARLAQELFAAGRFQALICLGGAEGAVLGAAAAKVLPIGVPKVIVSPIASGRRRFGPLVGTRDVVVIHSVVDILGLNPISQAIFDNAAAAVIGMLRHGHPLREGDGRYVAVTMLGNTTAGVMMLKQHLEARGYETVIFHANGVGGLAMEELAAQDLFVGVIDFTLNELANVPLAGYHAAPSRLEAVGALGIPQVVVPGCVDFAVFGPPQSVPDALRSRPHYYHNPEFTLVRLTRDEMVSLAAVIARKLNAARGPVAVAIPTRGLSIPNTPGGVFYDPDADGAFTEALCTRLRSDIPVRLVDTHINDPLFAATVAELFLEQMSSSVGTQRADAAAL